jgi:biopolymer transport protein ExbD
MAFTAARTGTDTMSDMNITPLVDVMLVLLVIFMVTAPLMDLRLGLNLSQAADPPPPPPESVVLQVEPGDMFRLAGQHGTVREIEATLTDLRQRQPALVVRLEVSPEADYQSAATAMAAVRRAGIQDIGLQP